MNPAEEYILSQSEPYRSILLHLQAVIEQTVPEVSLKYKYRVPFYYLDGRPFCYMNQSRDYVDLGFWNVNYFSRHREVLITEGRKITCSLRYRDLKEINNNILTDILEDAYKARQNKLPK